MSGVASRPAVRASPYESAQVTNSSGAVQGSCGSPVVHKGGVHKCSSPVIVPQRLIEHSGHSSSAAEAEVEQVLA